MSSYFAERLGGQSATLCRKTVQASESGYGYAAMLAAYALPESRMSRLLMRCLHASVHGRCPQILKVSLLAGASYGRRRWRGRWQLPHLHLGAHDFEPGAWDLHCRWSTDGAHIIVAAFPDPRYHSGDAAMFESDIGRNVHGH